MMITATARLPGEHLGEWREWIKLHGGNVVVPRAKGEKHEQSKADARQSGAGASSE